MPAKTIFSPEQRAAIFDPLTDREAVELFYTLGPDYLVPVCRRRSAANRIGYVVQLCYLPHQLGRPQVLAYIFRAFSHRAPI